MNHHELRVGNLHLSLFNGRVCATQMEGQDSCHVPPVAELRPDQLRLVAAWFESAAVEIEGNDKK